jgi:myo-inositol-1(or 4)-monophosphatase
MLSCPLSRSERASLASDCLDIAGLGAEVALSGFRTPIVASEKSARDLVTAFDIKTQERLLALLGERHPGVPIVAEEGGDPHAPLPRGLSFAVDPIDGTTNYAHGHPVWAVSIGVLYDGEPLAGAVVAPCISTRWHGYREGERGEAFRNDEACRVSATSAIERALCATGFPPDRSKSPDNNFASFVSVKRNVQAVRRCGAAAIDIAFVADGTYDGYWERRLHIWDAAAAAALVLAAGGRITALDGSPPRYRSGHIAATNGHIHDALVTLIHRDPGTI